MISQFVCENISCYRSHPYIFSHFQEKIHKLWPKAPVGRTTVRGIKGTVSNKKLWPRYRTWEDTSKRNIKYKCKAKVSRYTHRVPLVCKFQEEKTTQKQTSARQAITKRVLCISNGHGEDTVAVAVLKELRYQAQAAGVPLKIEVLPLVGLGKVYTKAGFLQIGPSPQVLPSGGFICTDRTRIVGDVKAGLIQLSIKQWHAVKEWAENNRQHVKEAEEQGGESYPRPVILTVGDVVPLLFTLAARDIQFGFIGCAKSEWYATDDTTGQDPRPWIERLVSPSCVYFPWERALLSRRRCQLIAPRDSATAASLRATLPEDARQKVRDLGNPMMDLLNSPPSMSSSLTWPDVSDSATAVLLLPGTRVPEMYCNFELILRAVNSVMMNSCEPVSDTNASMATLSERTTAGSSTSSRPSAAAAEEEAERRSNFPSSSSSSCRYFTFLAPLPPSVDLGEFEAALAQNHWALLQGRHQEGARIYQPAATSMIAEDRSEYCCGNEVDVAGRMEPPPDGHRLVLLDGSVLRGVFEACVEKCSAAVAMAGTATEQVVGFGRPAFILPGPGPQFTAEFARLQRRLLGKSVILCETPEDVGPAVHRVLKDTAALKDIAANGVEHMGLSGASERIAREIRISLLKEQDFC